jgi:hypothetical protein
MKNQWLRTILFVCTASVVCTASGAGTETNPSTAPSTSDPNMATPVEHNCSPQILRLAESNLKMMGEAAQLSSTEMSLKADPVTSMTSNASRLGLYEARLQNQTVYIRVITDAFCLTQEIRMIPGN